MKTKAYIALAFVSIVWGTTYLAIKLGIAHFPPLLFAAIRQVTSGILMFMMAAALGKKCNFSRSNILFQSFVGFLLITLGNGLVTTGEQWVSSGVAALICSLMPLVAVGINLLINKKERVNLSIVLGMLLAVVGVGIIFKDNLQFLGDRNFILGIIMIAIATSSWAWGSMLSRNRNEQSNPFFNSAIQVSAGGIFLWVIGRATGESVDLQAIPKEGWAVMLYLIIAGSLLAYTAYMYMLKHLPVGISTAYAYINPLVAVLVGWLIAREPLTLYTLLAFATIVGGVFLVNQGYKKIKATQ